MKYSFANFLLAFLLVSCKTNLALKQAKNINVKQHVNLEVLFTIYNQIWTPFLDEGVSESMMANTRLMKINHDHFRAFSKHKAVTKARDFMNRSGTDFFLYAFYYDDFPNAKRVREIPEILTKDINSNRFIALEEIDSLMSDIADFYEVSNFDEFYKKNDYVYKIAKQEILRHLPKDNFILFLESYFGTQNATYDFYIIPFFKAEFGMAHQLYTEKGIKNITFISPFEPAEIKNNTQITYVGYESESDVLEWVVHEYSHTFFNPSLTKKENLDLLDEYSHLYQPIKGQPQIGNWFSMFGEHIAVAFEVRAAYLLGNEDNGLNILRKHKNWKYLSHFITQLELYENNRDKYSDINEFMPILINSCKALQ